MLDPADFALQEQPEHSLMVAISRAWYNGSYTMAANPIKSLEMHYTMIQFLINYLINSVDKTKQPEHPSTSWYYFVSRNNGKYNL